MVTTYFERRQHSAGNMFAPRCVRPLIPVRLKFHPDGFCPTIVRHDIFSLLLTQFIPFVLHPLSFIFTFYSVVRLKHPPRFLR